MNRGKSVRRKLTDAKFPTQAKRKAHSTPLRAGFERGTLGLCSLNLSLNDDPRITYHTALIAGDVC